MEKFRPAKKNPLCYRCKKLYYVAMICRTNPKYVVCGGDNLSQECEVNTTSLEAPKHLPNFAYCGLQHPSNYKGFTKIAVKHQFHKSYRKFAAHPNNTPSEKKIQNKTTSTKSVALSAAEFLRFYPMITEFLLVIKKTANTFIFRYSQHTQQCYRTH